MSLALELQHTFLVITEGVKIEPIESSIVSPISRVSENSMNGHHMVENSSTRSPSTTAAWSPPNNMFISHPEFLKEVCGAFIC